MSTMRQVGLATLMFEGDHGRRLGSVFRRIARPLDNDRDYREMKRQIDDYVGEHSPAWDCPANSMEFGEDLNSGNLAFLLNNKGSTNPSQFFGYPRTTADDTAPRSLDQIISAGNGPVGRQANELSLIWMISDVDGQNYSAAQIGVANPGKPMSPDAQPVHNGGRTFVFFTGHAEFRGNENDFRVNH